jgi:FtsH-binding integral membrane protein
VHSIPDVFGIHLGIVMNIFISSNRADCNFRAAVTLLRISTLLSAYDHQIIFRKVPSPR